MLVEPRDLVALNKLSVKPVFDVSHGTNNDFMPFESLLDGNEVTYSDSTILGDTSTLDSVTADQITSGMPTLIQKQNTVLMIDAGDDTQFERIFFMKTNSAYEVSQCYVQVMFGAVITAYTSNDITFNSIDFEVRRYLGTNLNKYETLLARNQVTGHGTITAIDLPDLYLFKAQFSGVSIRPEDKIGLYFKLNITQNATNTYRCGYFPMFSFAKTNGTKTWYQSGIANHNLPSFDAANESIKHEIPSAPIDIFGAPVKV